MVDTQKQIKKIQKMKSDLKWAETLKLKKLEIEKKKKDKEEYMKYQEYLRKMVTGFLEKKIQMEKEEKLRSNKEDL